MLYYSTDIIAILGDIKNNTAIEEIFENKYGRAIEKLFFQRFY